MSPGHKKKKFCATFYFWMKRKVRGFFNYVFCRNLEASVSSITLQFHSYTKYVIVLYLLTDSLFYAEPDFENISSYQWKSIPIVSDL